MAIVISGVNNNDKITASDGTIDLLSGVNFNSELTVPSFKVGNNIQIGNAGIITATTYIGNLTGNVNATSNLLLQIGGSEKFRVGGSGQLGIGGANYGTSGQVLTSGGSGSAATWSTVTGTTINNNANYRLISGDANSNELNAESNLTYDGSVLSILSSANQADGLIIHNTNNSQAHADAAVMISGGDNASAFLRLENNSQKFEIIKDANHNLVIEDDGTERIRLDSSGHISQGGGATPTSSNGSVALKYGIKSNANNVIIGETTSSSNGVGLHLESRQTGRSGDARIAQIGLKNDASGNGQISFYTAPNSAGVAERMIINSHGLVTAPFQYHLHADRTGNQTGYNAGGDFGTPMIFNQIVSETKDSTLSSCYNTSNGLFTAPVTGLYLFNASVYTSGGGNIFSQSWFTLNGGRCSGTDWVINSGYNFVQNTQVIRLAAGNTVGFKPYAGGQSNVTLSANNNHTYFKVTLIG